MNNFNVNLCSGRLFYDILYIERIIEKIVSSNPNLFIIIY